MKRNITRYKRNKHDHRCHGHVWSKERTYHVLPHVLPSLVVPWLLWPPAPLGPAVLFSPGTPWWTVGIDCSVSGQCPDPSGDTRFRLPAVATVAGLTSAGRIYKINSTVNCLRAAVKVCLHVTSNYMLSKVTITLTVRMGSVSFIISSCLVHM